MNDSIMLKAAAFNLRAAAALIEDEYSASQLRLPLTVLSNAIDAAAETMTSALVNEIEFAMNDFVFAVDQLSAADAARFDEPLAMLRDDIARLKEATSLAPEVVSAMKALHGKLGIRKKAVERQTYVEGGSTDPLPHAPEELRTDALPIRDALRSAGYATPALDALIDDPASFRLHGILDTMNELEVALA
jgi:hypothetical protein